MMLTKTIGWIRLNYVIILGCPEAHNWTPDALTTEYKEYTQKTHATPSENTFLRRSTTDMLGLHILSVQNLLELPKWWR